MSLKNILGKEEHVSDEHLKWSRSICCYCGVGCGLLVGHENNTVKKIKGDPNHPANFGMICAKGGTLADMMQAPGRATTPLMRSSKHTQLSPVSWDNALEAIATKIKQTIEDHGPDSFAFYISGQLLTEDYYVINKFAKGYLGTNNVDSNSRLCMASAVAGYTTALGADGPPGSYEDIELSDCIFIIGANMAECHPVLFQRIRQHKLKNPKTKIIVVDPRKTMTCQIADIHLAVLPGTDLALLNGILSELIRNDKINRDFIQKYTNGWVDLEAEVLKDPIHIYANQTQIAVDDLKQVAKWIGESKGFVSFWTMGLNQSIHGTANNQAVINLHLALGQISKPGSGPFSLTGQPNAMGGRETGGLSTLLPGYRKIQNPKHREEMEALWDIARGSISANDGKHAVELFDALNTGAIKVIWVIATNPAVSMPRLAKIREGLQKAEMVIAQDAYHPTETSQLADIVLPAAQWAEREGTVTNSERRISLMRKILEPIGEARADWHIVSEVARRMGYQNAFNFNDSQSVYEEYKTTTKDTPIDITGVTYQSLKAQSIQWPYTNSTSQVSKRLYSDYQFAHADKKAKFFSNAFSDAQDIISRDYPLILTTGRIRDQWHTMTRTGKINKLLNSQSESHLDMHMDDMKRYGVKSGENVYVTSRRGYYQTKVMRSDRIKPGVVFSPMHWGSLFGKENVNEAVSEAVDKISKQPELKFSAVSVSKHIKI